MREDFSVIGKPLPSVDGVSFVTGKACFAVDITLPGMLYSKVLRSPHPHARIVKIDSSKAERLEGVKAVVTWKDVPRKKYSGADKFPAASPDAFVKSEYILDSKVRFVGDKVAFVAATSEEIAEKALDLIEVEYEKLPAVFDPEEAMKPGAPLVHESGNICREIPVSVGDVEKGFRETDYVFEDSYHLPIQHHYPLEPHTSVARVDENGKLTVWTSTQIPFLVRYQLSRLLGLPLSRVQVINCYVGGAFGARQDMVSEPIAAVLALKTRSPVKIQFTQEEMFYASRTRHPANIRLKTGVTKDGLFTARQCEVVFNSGAYASHGPAVLGYALWAFALLYRAESIKCDGYVVYTNAPQAGAFRGFGIPQILFATESQVDRIAEELNIDPLTFRLENIHRKGDIDPTTGYVTKSCGLPECLEIGAREIGWQTRRAAVKSGNRRKGVGMAVGILASNAKPALPEIASAVVKFNEDGTVNLVHGVADMGMGTKTSLAMIAAEVLGVRLEDVVTLPLDTDTVVYDKGTHASRSIYVCGNAVRLAAIAAREKLLKHAAKLLHVEEGMLHIKDRAIFAQDTPDRKLGIAEVIQSAMFGEQPEVIIGEASNEPEYTAPSFVAHFVEVEVDVTTGKTDILKIVAVSDVGKVINPLGARGQVEGAVLQGIGYALMEDSKIDTVTGRLTSPKLRLYKMPSSTDVPDIKIMFVESMDPTGPFGAKSLGELNLTSIAPAIANAIHNASGVRVKELPITSKKIIEALRNGKSET